MLEDFLSRFLRKKKTHRPKKDVRKVLVLGRRCSGLVSYCWSEIPNDLALVDFDLVILDLEPLKDEFLTRKLFGLPEIGVFLSYIFGKKSKRILGIGNPLSTSFPLNPSNSRMGQPVSYNDWWIPMLIKCSKETSRSRDVEDSIFANFFTKVTETNFRFNYSEGWSSRYRSPASLLFSEGTDISANIRTIAKNGAGHPIALEMHYRVERQDTRYLTRRSPYDPAPVLLGESNPVIWLPPPDRRNATEALYSLVEAYDYEVPLEEKKTPVETLFTIHQIEHILSALTKPKLKKTTSAALKTCCTTEEFLSILSRACGQIKSVKIFLEFAMACHQVIKEFGQMILPTTDGLGLLEISDNTETRYQQSRMFQEDNQALKWSIQYKHEDRKPEDQIAELQNQLNVWLESLLSRTGDLELTLSIFLDEFWDNTKLLLDFSPSETLISWDTWWTRRLTALSKRIDYQNEPLLERRIIVESQIDLFISHSAQDRELVKIFVELVTKSLKIDEDSIRCTSVAPYKLSAGDKTADILRQEVTNAKIVIGILTRSSIESGYVLFELGAAWGGDVTILPVVHPSIELSALPGPLGERHGIHLNNEDDIERVLEDLADKLSIDKNRATTVRKAVQGYFEALTEELATHELGKPDPK